MLWQLRYKGLHGLVLDTFIESAGDLQQARRVAAAWCAQESAKGFGFEFKVVNVAAAVVADDSILATVAPEPEPAATDARRNRGQDRRLARQAFGGSEAIEETAGA